MRDKTNEGAQIEREREVQTVDTTVRMEVEVWIPIKRTLWPLGVGTRPAA